MNAVTPMRDASPTGRLAWRWLLGWLRENIYRHGRKYTAPELVKKVTGSDVTIEPYLHYLRSKYAQYYHF